MSEFWNSCIRRAEELAADNSYSKELLIFYAELLRAQQEIYNFLRSRQGWLPSGSLPDDLHVLKPCFPILLRTVELNGPPALRLEAQHLTTSADDVITDLLLSYWRSPSAEQFFAKAFLQPYARWLAESGGRPIDRRFDELENRCPFCGGMPQLSCLQVTEAAESGTRDLVCATCLSTWTFRRVVCAYCLEERPFRLSIYQTAEYDYVRVEACDTCKRYIKGIDLTRFGLAVPLVDDVGSAVLDIWAQEQLYTKIELNLVGL